MKICAISISANYSGEHLNLNMKLVNFFIFLCHSASDKHLNANANFQNAPLLTFICTHLLELNWPSAAHISKLDFHIHISLKWILSVWDCICDVGIELKSAFIMINREFVKMWKCENAMHIYFHRFRNLCVLGGMEFSLESFRMRWTQMQPVW